MEDERQWSFREALEFACGLEDVRNFRWLAEPFLRHGKVTVRPPARGGRRAHRRGEFDDGIHHFREFVKQGPLDILHSDAALATGIKRAGEVAAMARQHGLESTFSSDGFLARGSNPYPCLLPTGPW